MSELKTFLSKINDICQEHDNLTIEGARTVISEINEFLYTTYDGIGTTVALGGEYQYFSAFHKYWEKNHKEILNIQIDRDACEKIADILHEVNEKTKGRVFHDLYDTNGLKDDEVCRVRFLTANQDFRGSRDFETLSGFFKDDPDVFEADYIVEHPEVFLHKIKVDKLTQPEKRISYAKTISEFLLERNSTPYHLLDYYDNDVYKLRQDLIECTGAGYGNKKADMFIRDMIVLGIWEDAIGFDKIDVASDVNTIKVALRTGILKTEIPLLSSFLDIFCYQYSYVDEMNAKAWRTVWEIWNEKYDDGIKSPSLLDYFIYGIVGRKFCKENLYTYKCVNDHTFYWNSRRKSVCPKCKAEAQAILGQYMCDMEDGSLITEKYELPEYNNCPFKSVCDICNNKQKQPPKSISILGQTGWTTGYTDKGQGGGGLMA